MLSRRVLRSLTQIKKSHYIRAPVEIVSATVSDVSRYVDFVPFCSKSEMDTETMIGKLTVEYGPVSTTWASDVTISEDRVLARNHGGGVVKSLSTEWSFQARKNGITKATVSIDFDLAGPFSHFEPIMTRFADDFVDAFKKEAEKRAKR